MAKELRLAAEQQAQARRTEGAGRDRLARTRHRHRRRRSRLPDRLAALDRDLPAAGRPLRPRDRRHAEGPPVSALARRSRRMRGAARQRAARRTRPARDPRAAARRAGAADRRGSRGEDWPEDALYDRLRRAWPFRSLAREKFDAVARMLAEGFATRNGRRGALIHRDAVNHMLRGRRGARTTALDLRRHDPRHRRLSGAARAGEPDHRHGQRGFRRREHGGRHFSARQRVLPHPAGRARDGAGRGRQGPAAQHSVLARRSAGPHRRAFRSPSRACAPRSPRGCAPIPPAQARGAGSSTRSASARPRPTSSSTISPRASRALGLPADARRDRVRALLRRSGRHAARHPRPLRQPHQPRLGSGAAQALLPQIQFRTAGGGDRRHYRPVADHGA